MENKKVYKSTKEYSNNYNKININVQLNRELIENIKNLIKEKNISLKEYIEKLLKDKL